MGLCLGLYIDRCLTGLRQRLPAHPTYGLLRAACTGTEKRGEKCRALVKCLIMNASAHCIRKIALFSGRVQGVGFRQTTVELAGAYKIGGTVRNLSDGSVEVILEATPDEIEKLLQDIEKRFAGFITSMTLQTHPVQGLLPGVRIIW